MMSYSSSSNRRSFMFCSAAHWWEGCCSASLCSGSCSIPYFILGGRLAQADLAVGVVFLCTRDPERNRLAHAEHRLLGELQTVRRCSAHFSFRSAAISASH